VSFLTFWQYEQSSPNPLNKFELNYKCETKIYKYEILKLVWVWNRSITLRSECRLRVFENRMPRRIFGPKMYEATGGWRKPPHEKIHNVYCSQDVLIRSRRMR
jgi:hypothetical protein